ncbi:MAG: ABC transporter permease [Gemmataceae bacterium]
MIAPAPSPNPSVLRAFLALWRLSLRRQWRLRAMSWAALGLLALLVIVVGVLTHTRQAWRVDREFRRVADWKKPEGVVWMSHQQYANERVPLYEMLPGPAPQPGIKLATLGVYQALMHDERFLGEYAFLSFSRNVVVGMYLAFLLPLFMLAYGSSAIGQEREDRTLVWLLTRPMPRSAVYLAKFLGVLPWCVGLALFAFGLLCLAGGEVGSRVFRTYALSVVPVAIAFAALFQLFGALFRRPAVLGLVYVFFFEALVANLPGSLKRLSLHYYGRSLVFNDAQAVSPWANPTTLDMTEPISTLSAWCVLLGVATVFTIVGMILFARSEPRDDE